jgi:phosphatidylserine decarboxylase
VVRVKHQVGKFLNAALQKAAEENERCSLVMRTEDGREVVAVQIAGLVARRIVCRVGDGRDLKKGERYGLIRFGSRVDVFVPAGTEPGVKIGDKTVSGESVIARLAPVGR